MQTKHKKTSDTKAIGLEVSLSITKFVTGKENLHYGVWDKLDPCLENLGKAQEKYTNLLFKYLPKNRKLKILDIGGGAGETAKKLVSLGHDVTIVVPSKILSERCVENTKGKAQVHKTQFEDYQPEKGQSFDVCLFSESFQYIPAKIALEKSKTLLNKNGTILIADCFRSEEKNNSYNRRPGGGHPLSEVRALIKELNIKIISEKEITKSVAPSLDIEQQFYNMMGFAFDRIREGLLATHPIKTKIFHFFYNIFLNKKRRKRLHDRFYSNVRSSKNFIKFNHYMIFHLELSK